MWQLIKNFLGWRSSEAWTRRRFIFLKSEDSAEAAAKEFKKMLDAVSWRRKGFLWARAFGWWLVTLLILSFLLGYRPAALSPTIPTVVPEDVAQASEEAESAEAEPGQPYNPLLGLREYLARMSGVVPAACAVTERGTSFPEPRRDRPGSPALLWWFGIDGEGDDEVGYPPCQWRRSVLSFLVAFSIDIGPIQKLTLFTLILAMVILRRERVGLDIDAAAFPDPAAVDEEEESRDKKLAQHPVAVHTGTAAMGGIHPFYPVPKLHLDDFQTRQHKIHLNIVRTQMVSYDRTGPFDLVKDVLEAGAASGRRGDADKRMREAVFEYNQALLGRLWPANYILWLLPTIGFLGTIYGISASLVRAKGMFDGGEGGAEGDFQKNIQLVVDGLGVAFDTTSLALVCATIVYFMLLRTEWLTDKLTAHAQASLSGAFIARMLDRENPPPPGDAGGVPADARSETQGRATAVQGAATVASEEPTGGGPPPAGPAPPTNG